MSTVRSSSEQCGPIIGIITVLPKEYAAVKAMMDNPGDWFVPTQRAGEQYCLGEMPAAQGHKHSVVLSLAVSIGTDVAAVWTSSLSRDFPTVRTVIMVGIAGGVPHPKKPDDHVRLGDVVVSNEKGVMHYEFVTQGMDEPKYRWASHRPSARLLHAAKRLEADTIRGKQQWVKLIDRAKGLQGTVRPEAEKDVLYSFIRLEGDRWRRGKKVVHPTDSSRREGEPRVFIGPIASANTLLKDPFKRDKLRDLFAVKAVEMEAAGIVDAAWIEQLDYLVVRGICDYCDPDKNNLWQGYAAVAAAAYVRGLLELIPSQAGTAGSTNEPPPDLARLRADYLQHLKNSYRALDFKGIPQLESFSRELLLEDVYVPLLASPELPAGETLERRLAGRAFGLEALPEEALAEASKVSAAPVPVEQALAEKSRIVIVGDPGSGKTTLLKHLALRLADEDAPLPILAPLNAYAEALSRRDCNLQAWLPAYYAGRTQEVAGLGPLFDSAIAQGRALILLDGLDEVQRERAHLVDKVEAFAREAAAFGNKVVVTSRIVGYRESPLGAREWALYTLLDFGPPAIKDFAAKWCLAFERSTLGDTPEARSAAETERQSLLEAIEANPGVSRLAANPLLLTILALIKRQGVTLPNRRVELYELYLKTLISAWGKARALDKKPVGQPLDYLQTISILGPLALWLREENPTAGLVPEERLIEWLTKHFTGEDWGLLRGEASQRARDFLESVRKYSNLLLERGQGRFGFIHLTFEEALAGRGLVQLGQLSLGDSLAVICRHLTDPAWRETILLAVGVWGLVREEPRKAGEVVCAMLKATCAREHAGQNVLIAGACLEDVSELGIGRVATQEVTEALLAACRNRALPPTAQRDAGFILGRTGWVPPDLEAFIPIEAGPFLYGDEKRKVVLKQPFAIGKYPVTNRQYRRFMEAGGYHLREFWSDEGWAWRTGTYDSKAPKEYKDWLARRSVEWRREPFY